MPAMEAIVIEIGNAAAKSILKFWLRDVSIAQDVSADLSDILARKLPGILDQRRTRREFERIAEEVAERLEPYFDIEFGGLPNEEKNAAAHAVANTIGLAKIDQELLLHSNLDPIALEDHLRKSDPHAVDREHLSEAAAKLYDIALSESCNYITDIVLGLPNFSTQATLEILRRESQIVELVKKTLDAIPQSPLGLHDGSAGRFEVQYRRTIARKLDRVELFGLDLPELRRRYSLSIAYVTLLARQSNDASAVRATSQLRATEGLQHSRAEPHQNIGMGPSYVRVHEALAGSRRVLIRGLAGSGKTTLLQWLGVHSARNDFDNSLEDWSDSVPFLIELRHYANRELPTPESFILQHARHIADLMPPQWVHNQLEAGRALLLIDGIDELSQSARPRVREWLADLTMSFPDSRYVVTSRPSAVSEGWLAAHDFIDTELQPMTVTDIKLFVDHWHRAAAEDLPAEHAKLQLQQLATQLKAVIRDNSSIRSLASNPLLCAMLCSLHRERKTQLPRDRIGLYSIALEMMLERRDVDRELRLDGPILSLTEKYLLLQDLAYWLLNNNRSDSEKHAAIERTARKLESMPHVVGSPQDVFDYLLLRSGLLREPVQDRVDFIHRTFQEYLAAKEAVEGGDIGLLLDKAGLDTWREVVLLAAGHARRAQREELIVGLLEKGSRSRKLRHRLHLLAIACLETSSEISPRLRAELEKTLASLGLPKSMAEARDVASAGELAIPALASAQHMNAEITAASIRALSLIGGATALEALTRFGEDGRVPVVRELVRAWANFPLEEFAKKVLHRSPLEDGYLEIDDAQLLPFVLYLRNLNVLDCEMPGQLDDLEDLGRPEIIRRLNISDNPSIVDLSPLERCSNLEVLRASNCPNISNLWPLRRLPAIKSITLSGCKYVSDLKPLQDAETLRRIHLERCVHITDLSPMKELHGLRRLTLRECLGVDDLSPLKDAEQISFLEVSKCPTWDLAALAGMKRLVWLDLSWSREISNLSPLSGLSTLHTLILRGLSRITSVQALSELGSLNRLDMAGCTGLSDLSPIGALPNLKRLDLTDCSEIVNLGSLNRSESLEALTLLGCRGISDLTPLLKLKSLQVLSISGMHAAGFLDLATRRGIRVLVDVPIEAGVQAQVTESHE